MQLKSLAEIVHGQLKGEDHEFSGVSIDTRSIKSGQLFIVFSGENHEGHQFVAAARHKGAAAALVERYTDDDLPQIKVANTQKALWQYAAWARQHYNPVAIGLTGSCGKTTLRQFLESIFSRQGSVLATQGNFNNHLGVPLMLTQLGSSHEFLIIEMGASATGEIAALAGLLQPDTAVITNAAAAHLSGFGSRTDVATAKAEIYSSLSAGGTAIINRDSEFYLQWRQRIGKRRTISFGLSDAADVYAEHIQFNAQGCASFQLVIGPEKAAVSLSLLGEHNVTNALAACAVAYAHQLPVAAIVSGLEETTAVARRMQEFQGIKSAQIIDDSYNASPLSVAAALNTLSVRPGRKIFVFADMLELGNEAVELHYKVGEKALALGLDALYCYGDLAGKAAEAFGNNAYHFSSQNDLLKQLQADIDSKSVVLVKGSNSMGMQYIVSRLT